MYKNADSKVKKPDLRADYDRVIPPPHVKPFDGIRAVWGIQVSGRHGFVIDKKELPY